MSLGFRFELVMEESEGLREGGDQGLDIVRLSPRGVESVYASL